MTNKVVKTKFRDSTRGAIFHFYLESDGLSGELTNYTLIDPAADFAKALSAGQHLTVTQMWSSVAGFDCTFKYDALEDVAIWVAPRAPAPSYADFRYFGGLKDRSGADPTGKLTLTTSGFANTGSVGVLTIEVVKD